MVFCRIVKQAACAGLCIALIVAQAVPRQPARPESSPHGIVFVVGGVGGIGVLWQATKWAMANSGIQHETRFFPWTHGHGKVLRDLQDTQHLLTKSVELADEIRLAKASNPEKPIYLIGRSGGAGLVLAAVEQLPPATVDRIILLSAAVSPSYDLRPALLATKQEIVAFYSPLDQLVLNWGTNHFGTIDRFYGPSAGLKGFVVPAGLRHADQLLYKRLVQLPWDPKMILEGNTGGHAGSSMPGFIKWEVTPWLKP
jgi:pimeloyl-ACP methyl ester carboxylesterase